jgi:hypothetical protein
MLRKTGFITPCGGGIRLPSGKAGMVVLRLLTQPLTERNETALHVTEKT